MRRGSLFVGTLTVQPLFRTIKIFDRVDVVPTAAAQSELPATRTYLFY
jgi:hypothetical protein